MAVVREHIIKWTNKVDVKQLEKLDKLFTRVRIDARRSVTNINRSTTVINNNLILIRREANKTAEAIRKPAADFRKLAGVLTIGLSAPLALFSKASITAAARMDALTRGLTAVSGSAAIAQAELARLREVAKLPGLGIEDAVQGSTNLQAAGLSAELARRSLLAFGNALATVGKGKADLKGVNLALGQIAAKGKITGQELRQLQERLPQIRQAMLAAFGTADSAELTKRGLNATEFITGVVEQFEKLPKVTSGLQNLLENFSDSLFLLRVEFGNTFVPLLATLSNFFVPIIEKAADALGSLGTSGRFLISFLTALTIALPPIVLLFGLLNTQVGLLFLQMLAIPLAILAAIVLVGILVEDIVGAFRGDEATAFGKNVVFAFNNIGLAFGFLVDDFIEFFDTTIPDLVSGVVEFWINEFRTGFASIKAEIVDFFSFDQTSAAERTAGGRRSARGGASRSFGEFAQNLAPVPAEVAAGAVPGAAGGASTQITNNVEIQVPEGTTAEQQEVIKTSVADAFTEANNQQLRNTRTAFPQGD